MRFAFSMEIICGFSACQHIAFEYNTNTIRILNPLFGCTFPFVVSSTLRNSFLSLSLSFPFCIHTIQWNIGLLFIFLMMMEILELLILYSAIYSIAHASPANHFKAYKSKNGVSEVFCEFAYGKH